MDHDHTSLEAERAVLGAMLYTGLRPRLEPHHFFSEAHRKIYARMLELDAPNLVSLRHILGAHGELEAVGGDVYLASLADLPGTNLEAHADHVRELARRRAIVHTALRAAQDAQDPGASVEAQLERIRESLDTIGHDAVTVGRFRAAAHRASDFIKLEIPRPQSLLGDGVLTAGGFLALYGQPGLGKSWLALDLAISIARGEPWLGIPTAVEGARVGVIQLELGAHTLKERIQKLGIGGRTRDEDLRILCRPYLSGVVDLFKRPQDVADLKDWIRADGLSLVMLDAFSRAHTANENAGDEVGVVLASIDALRHETGCAVGLIHHEPKANKERDAENHLDALRGHSRLQSDPTLAIRVVKNRGLRRIVFAKVTEGATPDDVFYHIRDNGTPEVVKSPEQVGNENAEKIVRVISEAGRPIAKSEIEANTGMTGRTVQRHLKNLVDEGRISSSGQGRSTTYETSRQSRQDDEWRDGSASAPNSLGDRWE